MERMWQCINRRTIFIWKDVLICRGSNQFLHGLTHPVYPWVNYLWSLFPEPMHSQERPLWQFWMMLSLSIFFIYGIKKPHTPKRVHRVYFISFGWIVKKNNTAGYSLSLFLLCRFPITQTTVSQWQQLLRAVILALK